ncbi:A24 family peptidase [Aestuariivirga sp.]|uniref:prepilin peptidase n=1 Tax=Aestuariivirga sp. TaxID=2650926 RepID=UPI0025B90F2D|nr:A24 family peptidase [Aestuariivirga sp.]MCA3555450.1 prepilin peptidase [Aestuariivirga sp.]
MDEQPADDSSPLLNRTELVGAAAAAAAVGIAAMFLAPPLAALATAVLALLMGLITLIDFRHFIIPNALSYPAVPLGIAANIALFHPGDWTAGLTESLLGAALGGGIFFLMRALWFRLRGIEGLGLGDVKLAAVAGAWLGPALLPTACLVASLAGLCGIMVMKLMGRRVGLTDEIPFGSFIAPVILLVWIGRVAADVPFW